MSVILIGYRGSGKSSVGRRVAARMGWKFADADDLLVERAGMTIKEIFEKHGEAHFRDLESTIVAELCREAACAIALGGGAILRDENRATIKQSGHRVIYLHSNPETLYARILADPQTQRTRPNLTHLGGGVEEIRELLAKRLPLYREVMTDELDVTHLSSEQAAEAIVKLIQPGSH